MGVPSSFQEINNLKTELEATKFDVIKYCVGEEEGSLLSLCLAFPSLNANPVPSSSAVRPASQPSKMPTFWLGALLTVCDFHRFLRDVRYSRFHKRRWPRDTENNDVTAESTS